MRFGAGGGGMSAFDALRFVSAVELGLDMVWSEWGSSLEGDWRFLAETQGGLKGLRGSDAKERRRVGFRKCCAPTRAGEIALAQSDFRRR